ncbi:hypothetical protein BAE39_27530 [Mesorhizobium loti]|uniref:Uncharacterized protein n=1 Tax=Rhizobium loti TaxID=381 RepID=A0A1A5ILX1_RHILI|nr:hypothetical protein BAE39_27530 [Mesorhizobium loti]OBQ59124.1 hypothetical protein A8145_26150 [Mesorhizobium loti]QKC73287.1 hypothetical protein EB815_32390 [Mesorhizobium loti]
MGIGRYGGDERSDQLATLDRRVFMLEVYDRVLPSRSVPTLVGLVILAGGLFVFQGWLDVGRARLFIRVGRLLDERLSGRVHETLIGLPLVNDERGDGSASS